MRTVLVHRTFLRRLGAALLQAIPCWLRTAWRGPVDTITLGEPGNARRWVRPADLLIPPELVLKHRLIIPRGARRDLGPAIDLFIDHKTPFAPSELLVHAVEDASSAPDGHAAYTVRAVPRTLVEQALSDHAIGRLRLGRIVIAGVLSDAVDFAPALLGVRGVARWSFAAPVAIALASFGTLVAGDLSGKYEHVAALETEVSAALARVRALRAELDEQGAAEGGVSEASRMLETVPSVYAVLTTVRRSLPDAVEVTKLEVRGPDTRLSVRTNDVLSIVQRLNDRLGANWAATIDGPITADAASGREAATILLRGPDA